MGTAAAMGRCAYPPFAVPRNSAFVGMSLSFLGFQFLPMPGNGACLAQIKLSNTLDATIR